MYRAAALKALRLGTAMDDADALGVVAGQARIELTDRGRGPVLLDGRDVTEAIRAEKVSVAASLMSTVPQVRRELVRQQREIGRHESCVMEGRDIGTVVFPDADLKVFLVASIEERARRRYLQSVRSGAAEALGETGSRAELELKDAVTERELRSIAEGIAERDRRDSTRSDSPLLKADDAVEVDTTGLTIEEQVERVIALALERGAVPPGANDRSGEQ